MKLFDNIKREDLRPAYYNQPTYNYYNLSAREDISTIRNILDSWFQEYPDCEKYELKSRFKKTFYDSFYELFLFILFKRSGFEIEIHPSIENSIKRPDFLIKKNNVEIYIEAKSVNGKSQKEEASENLMNKFYDDLNKTKINGYGLHLEKLNLKTNNQPKTKNLIEIIEKESIKIIEIGSYDNEKIYIDNNDITLIVSLIPLKNRSNSHSNRTICIHPLEISYGGGENYIRKGINSKSKKFAVLQKPYIVCINAIDNKVTSKDDIDSAVWGTVAICTKNEFVESGTPVHSPDGVFYNKKPVNRNLSGVLISRVFPHNIKISEHFLYKHPFSKNIFDFRTFGLEFWEVGSENFLVKVEGQQINNIII